MIVMKFGGTSVANYEAISRTISIVEGKLNEQPIVVVSALSKITDLLYKIADTAASGDKQQVEELIKQLRERHLTVAGELLDKYKQVKAEAFESVNKIIDDLADFAKAVCSLGELTDRSKARIISTGEYLSSTIICYTMNALGIKTGFINAREFMITTDDHLKGEPIDAEIVKRAPGVIAKAYEGKDAVITQGFVSLTQSGEPAVLGRGGSDYSASLIGMAVDAKKIEIWTDVDGVRTCDPRKVANTQSIEKISFEEAAEMAHFGAKVLHPLTMEPAIGKNIPIYVLNSMNPSGKGTVILRNEYIEPGVKALSFKQNIRLVNIFSTRMINTPGFLNKTFEIFGRHNVSVDFISTSEANISLTMDAAQDIDVVVEELSEFAQVQVFDDKSQISVIGKDITKIEGKMFDIIDSLKGYRVYMISQGATDVNISFVVDREKLDEIINVTHQHLFEK
jgi:aspartate kinase